jgi:hypothetical protein
MTELQKEFEATGYTSWINADLYPDGKIYTQEYTQWLERQVLALRQPLVVGRSEQFKCHSCGTNHSGENDDQLYEVCRACFDGI